METWIVITKEYNRKEISAVGVDGIGAYWDTKLFQPLEAIAEELNNGELILVNKMEFIGVAVIEATDTTVKILQDRGFDVQPNRVHTV